MILITTYYKNKNLDRQYEIDQCLIKNSNNKYIKEIYLLGNEYFNLSFIENRSKIKQIIINNEKKYKLKYNDSIKFINKNLENNLCILANSDIYFDNSLEKLIEYKMENKLFALLRYDLDSNGNYELFKRYNIPRNDSQDSWIFKSPLNVDLNNFDFSLGTLGCDSVFAQKIYEEGYKISNPSLDIISVHYHLIDYRTYSTNDRLYGKYCLIEAGYLEDDVKLLFIEY
jgi:hypothetical protein